MPDQQQTNQEAVGGVGVDALQAPAADVSTHTTEAARLGRLELWGGVECTINRVGETFFDQAALSGHRDRTREDLERFERLGLRTLRTGLHWEHFAATGSWATFDRLLGDMRELGLRPIAGLLHHGSGPKSTDLLDPGFPEKLAAYALTVAERYPFLIDYTPVNEPQTTSRFSCLYGHWYPHHRSLASYVRALYHQLKGIALSMQAIRSVQPAARLIHTEDGGVTFATPQLEEYRAERELRRWLGTDLLCGRVDRGHAAFAFLREHGLGEDEILWFAEHPCPPAVLGLNYYVTSDRYLDHRLELYPPHFAGGDSAVEPLVDIEAIRVRPEGIAGIGAILQAAWQRYGLPVAITEAHLGGSPEDQVRWLDEVWRAAEAARRDGAEVRAVAVWALLGSWNWANLCTADAGIYEPGVFDLRDGTRTPRAGVLADLVQELAQGRSAEESTARQAAWWSRPDRLTYPPYVAEKRQQQIPAG